MRAIYRTIAKLKGFFIFLLLVLFPLNSYAYIDPNAGGIIFQFLFPIVAGLGALLTVFRKRLSSFFSRILNRVKKSYDR